MNKLNSLKERVEKLNAEFKTDRDREKYLKDLIKSNPYAESPEILRLIRRDNPEWDTMDVNYMFDLYSALRRKDPKFKPKSLIRSNLKIMHFLDK